MIFRVRVFRVWLGPWLSRHSGAPGERLPTSDPRRVVCTATAPLLSFLLLRRGSSSSSIFTIFTINHHHHHHHHHIFNSPSHVPSVTLEPRPFFCFFPFLSLSFVLPVLESTSPSAHRGRGAVVVCLVCSWKRSGPSWFVSRVVEYLRMGVKRSCSGHLEILRRRRCLPTIIGVYLCVLNKAQEAPSGVI